MDGQKPAYVAPPSPRVRSDRGLARARIKQLDEIRARAGGVVGAAILTSGDVPRDYVIVGREPDVARWVHAVARGRFRCVPLASRASRATWMPVAATSEAPWCVGPCFALRRGAWTLWLGGCTRSPALAADDACALLDGFEALSVELAAQWAADARETEYAMLDVVGTVAFRSARFDDWSVFPEVLAAASATARELTGLPEIPSEAVSLAVPFALAKLVPLHRGEQRRYLLSLLPAPPRREPFAELSDAQQRVATLAAEGATARQIAGRLSCAEGTVRVHLRNVYKKLGVRTRVELVQVFSQRARHDEAAAVARLPR